MHKRLLALLLLAALMLSACGMRQEQGEEVRYGYVADYDAAAHTLLLDEVEWLTPDDAQRLSQLGLSLGRGESYRVYDADTDREKLKTADELVFYHYVAGGVAAGTADGYGENSTGTFDTARNNNNSSDNALLADGRIDEMHDAVDNMEIRGNVADGVTKGNGADNGGLLGEAARGVGDAVGDAARGVGDAVGDAARGVGDAVGDAARDTAQLGNDLAGELRDGMENLPDTPETVDMQQSVDERNMGTPGYTLDGDSDAADSADDYQLIDYPFAGRNWAIRDARLAADDIGRYLQQQGSARGLLCRIYLRDGVVVAVEELQPGDFSG